MQNNNPNNSLLDIDLSKNSVKQSINSYGKGKPVPKELKSHIIKQIKDHGLSVIKASEEYSISTKTIYNWINGLNSTDTDISALIKENTRLKREKAELIDMIGHLTVDVSRLVKKKS